MNAFLFVLAVYPWLATWGGAPPTTPLDQRFPAPTGYRRVDVAPEGFGAWLRALPVRTDRADVRAYDGRPLFRPAAAVVALDVGTADLQQCADSLVRLRSEFLWQAGAADRAAWHFTSGDRSAWADWRRGERFRVAGARVERVRGAKADGYAAFRAWLTFVFQYAGTRSLPLDTAPVPPDRPLEPGDVFVDPGAPGHAVMLLDVAVDGAGHRVALVGQGYMPAEDFHVLAADDAVGRVWFALPDAAHPALATPAWRPFPRSAARRWR